ncbi:MAG: TetR family transcriptional regulator [Rhodobacteraceae bacterium]|nr:TetR family transcriptional regulator [Paracoccaceae bacterium]
MPDTLPETSPDTAPETAPKAKRKRLPSGERRQEFIAQAIEFFAENGFESSTRDLAKRLGVTQPLLYRYFPSKDDLIAEVYSAVYVKRWRPEWEILLADRTRPLADRMRQFYREYTDVVFTRDWMRIFLFAGLKGVDINIRYMGLVRSRILDPIVAESRAEAGLPDADGPAESDFAWLIHGGIFYNGVRRVVYGEADATNKDQMIDNAVEAMLSGLDRIREGGPAPRVRSL